VYLCGGSVQAAECRFGRYLLSGGGGGDGGGGDGGGGVGGAASGYQPELKFNCPCSSRAIFNPENVCSLDALLPGELNPWIN
jgi:hypothetical protein